MKKKLSIVLAIILIAAVGVAVWFYGYYNRKSNDNLPALTAITEMSESDANSLLPGYRISQLREVWGEPDSSEDGTDSWQIGNVTLVVNYKNNGVVAICGLKDDSGASLEEHTIENPNSWAIPAHFCFDGKGYFYNGKLTYELPEGYEYVGDVINVGDTSSGSGKDFEGNVDGRIYMNQSVAEIAYFSWAEWDEEIDGAAPFLKLEVK